MNRKLSLSALSTYSSQSEQRDSYQLVLTYTVRAERQTAAPEYHLGNKHMEVIISEKNPGDLLTENKLLATFL